MLEIFSAILVTSSREPFVDVRENRRANVVKKIAISRARED